MARKCAYDAAVREGSSPAEAAAAAEAAEKTARESQVAFDALTMALRSRRR